MDDQLKAKRAAQKRAARARRSEEQKAIDRSKNAARMADARRYRTEQKTAADRAANRERMAAIRAAQTEQQKALSRSQDAERKRLERAQETPLQREQRLANQVRWFTELADEQGEVIGEAHELLACASMHKHAHLQSQKLLQGLRTWPATSSQPIYAVAAVPC
jgi:hypothetical protein